MYLKASCTGSERWFIELAHWPCRKLRDRIEVFCGGRAGSKTPTTRLAASPGNASYAIDPNACLLRFGYRYTDIYESRQNPVYDSLVIWRKC